MKTLGGSYLKFFTCQQREKERVVWCSREIALSRQETGFLGHQKHVRDGFYLAVSFQHKYINSISAASSSQTLVESEEIETIYSDQPKTVHVRFKLQKECAFGQQFLIVGDDPIVGLWDPSDGVPLNWSDGHVWTAEMDIPCGKVIKYKFILKGETGNISWQPGPDRILETWDTEKTITVFEDWDSPELQKIVEEELVADPNEESLINSDFSIVTENLNQPQEESLIDSDLLIVAKNLNLPILDEGTDVIKQLANDNDHTNDAEETSAPMVAENITEELGEQDLSSTNKESGLMSVTDQKKKEKTTAKDVNSVNGSNLLSSRDETSSVEEVPVLVQGLVLMPTEEIEAAEINQVENNSVDNTIIGSDEIEDSTEPELKDEHVSASLHSKETSEMMTDERQQMYGEVQLESDILETDMQWGRRTLQKFLANLGFQ